MRVQLHDMAPKYTLPGSSAKSQSGFGILLNSTGRSGSQFIENNLQNKEISF